MKSLIHKLIVVVVVVAAVVVVVIVVVVVAVGEGVGVGVEVEVAVGVGGIGVGKGVGVGGNVGKYTTHGAYEIAMIANASVTTIYQPGLLSDDPSEFRASQVRD